VLSSIQDKIESNSKITKNEFDELIGLNKNYYYPWFLAGKFYFEQNEPELALSYFSKAIKLEIPQESTYREILEMIENCRKNL
jgi:tetratricopeptide (TPR) repeat protein